MAEIFFTFFLFIAITCVTALVFGGWLIYGIIRTIWRVMHSIALNSKLGAIDQTRAGTAGPRCPTAGCRMRNPVTARFCRRCGTTLPEAQRVSVRRAAMW